MRVLLTTHHLHSWAGSELVTIELFEEFTKQGHDVSVFCPFVHPTFLQQAFGQWRDVIRDAKRIDIAHFDLVIVLHQTASRFLHLQEPDRLFGDKRPFFVFMHLSPYEQFEAPGVVAQPDLADLVLANSEETRAALAEYGVRDVGLFPNPAPSRFVDRSGAPETLKRILSVSNHLPQELSTAFELLEGRGYEVYRIGQPDNARRLRPYHLFEHDAVVTTGKTVQYALRAGRPVYCYDHFQGPGWIHTNFEDSARTNFSGRCSRGRKSPEELAADIEAGFADACQWLAQSADDIETSFALEAHVARMVEAASKPRLSKPLPEQGWEAFATQLKLESTIYSQVDRFHEMETGILSEVVAKPLEDEGPPPAISVNILREPAPDEAMIFAVFSFRYDAHLVPALLENIGPAIHGYACWDDRLAPEDTVFTDETIRQRALFKAAKTAGAEWILAIDPDERLEDSVAGQITAMTTKFGPVIWEFNLREMFTDRAYRTDGIWGGRSRARLFPCLPGMEPDGRALHGNWTRNALHLPLRQSGLNIYHLRMATPERRRLRRELYARLDPERTFQRLGYDYLDDDRGQSLMTVPEHQTFTPAHEEDHELWASPQTSLGDAEIRQDLLENRLFFLSETRRRSGFAAAFHQAEDLCREHPDDLEYSLFAADCALRAKEWSAAARISREIVDADPEIFAAWLILTRSLNALGRSDEAKQALEKAEALVPGSQFCRREREELRPAPKRFGEPDAVWRRWATGPVVIHEGAEIARSDLTFVVISMGAPDDLQTAVASLCEQSTVPEIVVVNSRGGDAMAALGPYAKHVRVISAEQRLYPGAARNVGIDASTGRFVAFLASDCAATPGSVAKRLDLHQAGARAVSAFVLPEDATRISQRVASNILHSTRHPASGLAAVKKYSLSYERDLFEQVGYFSPSLRVSEDTYLNAQVAEACEIVSDKDVCITHRYPDDNDGLIKDMERRAKHRVGSPFFAKIENVQDLMAKVSDMHEDRSELTQRNMRLRREDLSDTERGAIEALIPQMLEVERHATFRFGMQVLEAQRLVREAETLGPANPERREAKLRRALDLQSNSPWVKLRLGQCLLAQGDTSKHLEAEALLQAAADASLGDPTLLRAQIDALIAAGKSEAAVVAFERACLLNPNSIHMWAAHAVLKSAANRPLRVFCLHQMFFIDLLDGNVAKTLAENHLLSGNFRARAARARNSDVELTEASLHRPGLPRTRSRLLSRGKAAVRRLFP